MSEYLGFFNGVDLSLAGPRCGGAEEEVLT